MKFKRVVVVGLGGGGTFLVQPLCRYLAYSAPETQVVLIDGDNFEPKNAERQIFTALGNKADVTAAHLRPQFSQLQIETKPRYVTEDNVYLYIKEGDCVFSCVDNHASRKLLSDHCSTLEDVVLISGGNEFDDGNVRMYIRRQGKDLFPPLTHQHPEIQHPTDRNPAELDCLQLAATGSPQLIFANLKAATEMVCLFWVVCTNDDPTYNEVYFDLKTGAQRPVRRNMGE